MIEIPCDGLLFDNDGVLVDSDAGVRAAWGRWATDRGLDPDEVNEMVHGRRAADTVALLVAEAGRAAALHEVTELELAEAEGTTEIPGAGALLRSLPPHVWAVVTSGVAPLAKARISAAGLPAPTVVVTAEDVAEGKPAPDCYLAAARALGVDPARAAVLEDSGAGIAAGRAAGAGALVGVGVRGLETDADVVVRDLSGLSWADGVLRVAQDSVLRAGRR
ncbi:HAD-IA family hydrolase [Umezawaea beigongshangensis]|uniref:HAD-IA family hydrolase n=1 Tax=Umezawaea beigongshangensis TaxID=2780383 RepID=UPI0018F1940C|nr:HAD-IA family hydrolase [Umezawaea beigongshangensis]